MIGNFIDRIAGLTLPVNAAQKFDIAALAAAVMDCDIPPAPRPIDRARAEQAAQPQKRE
jgi:hypothetical protein